MLPRKNRIPSYDIGALRKNGVRSSTPLFDLSVGQTHTGLFRAAIRVSARVHRHAVGRNAIKRHIRETVRLCLPRLKNDQDVLIRVIRPLPIERSIIQKSVIDALTNAGCFSA